MVSKMKDQTNDDDTKTHLLISLEKNTKSESLRKRLNLSKNGWKQFDLPDDKWHDEIYTTRKGDPFYKYSIHKPICKSFFLTECSWKTNQPPIEELSIPKKTIVNKLNLKIIELKYKILLLSIINIGLVVTHLLK